jgi:hypothetical protein
VVSTGTGLESSYIIDGINTSVESGLPSKKLGSSTSSTGSTSRRAATEAEFGGRRGPS